MATSRSLRPTSRPELLAVLAALATSLVGCGPACEEPLVSDGECPAECESAGASRLSRAPDAALCLERSADTICIPERDEGAPLLLLCVARISDGSVYWTTRRVRGEDWRDCTPGEEREVSTAPECDPPPSE